MEQDESGDREHNRPSAFYFLLMIVQGDYRNLQEIGRDLREALDEYDFIPESEKEEILALYDELLLPIGKLIRKLGIIDAQILSDGRILPRKKNWGVDCNGLYSF